MAPLTIRGRRVVTDFIGKRRDFDGQNEWITISGSISGYSLYDGHPQNPRVNLIAEWWNPDLCLIQRDQRDNPITRYLIRLIEEVGGISWQYAGDDGEPDGINPDPDTTEVYLAIDPAADVPAVIVEVDSDGHTRIDPEPPARDLAADHRSIAALLIEERDRIMRRARHAKANRHGPDAADILTSLVNQARQINYRALSEYRAAAAY